MQFNIINVIFDFFQVIVGFMTQARNFLFQEINIFGYSIQLFYVLGGTLFTVLFVAWIIKRFI